MKRVFIVHQWSSGPDKDWYPWLKRELEQKGFEVFVPEMPGSDQPKIGTWVPFLKQAVGDSDTETYFIGHSVGCQTILRLLETLLPENKIGGAIFVAGWFKLQNLEDKETEMIAKPWIETPIDFPKIKRLGESNKLKAILSNNDRYVPLKENKEIFENILSTSVRVETNMGHFTEDDGVTDVPVVLEELLKMAR